jgi:hypothetical protein
MDGYPTYQALAYFCGKFGFPMLSLDDKRWPALTGGYRTPFDPRSLLLKLETDDAAAAWKNLWEELHHQGDVGDASYAAVPHLVRIYRQHRAIDWNTYAIVAVIELARGRDDNSDVPKWLEQDYFQALRELAEKGITEVLRAKTSEELRAILSVLAISKGARTHARFLLDYSEEELLELETRASQPKF